MMKLLKCLICITLYTCITISTSCASNFYKKRAEGWHWYEERPKTVEEDQDNPQKTPTEQVEALKAELNHLLNKAILNPTHENVILYKKKQEAFMEQSHEFARVWRDVTFLNPELDYSLKFPSQHSARAIYKETQGREREHILRSLSKTHGLFFIFRSDCPYCEGFAPLVQQFSKKYGWSVVAISGDGGSLKEFPQAKKDNGMIQNLGIKVFPALLAVQPDTGNVIPLSYGMTSMTEIETRAAALSGARVKNQEGNTK